MIITASTCIWPDRRLLALLELMVRGGYRPSFAGVDDTTRAGAGRTRPSELGVPLLAPVVTGEDLLDWVRHHDVAVVVLLLWFWKKASVPRSIWKAAHAATAREDRR